METLSKDGTRIYYEQTGSGPALILIDGALCNTDVGPMKRLSELLSPHFRVIYYDRRGRGKSTNTVLYSYERELEDIEALIKVAGEKVLLFGMSSGSYLALLAAGRNPGVSKVAVYEPPPSEDSGMGARKEDIKRIEDLLAQDRRSDALKFFLTKLVKVPGIAVTIMSWFPMWKLMCSNVRTLPNDLKLSNDQASLRSGTVLSMPVMVVCGDKTTEGLKKASEKVVKEISTASHYSLKGQDHNVSPRKLAPVLLEFYKR